jgi:hypothetical protein
MKSKIWDEAYRVGLVAGTYSYDDLTEEQRDLIERSWKIKVYSNDTVILSYNNLEYLEWRAEKKGLLSA